MSPIWRRAAALLPLRRAALPFLLSSAAVALNNGAALTPPMGFASWSGFQCDYDDALFREMADAMVSTGLAAKGYEYMLVQECIVPAGARDPVTGVVMPDANKFPRGLADLAGYFHSKGLKAGIYTDVMNETCAGFEGSGPGPGHASHWPLDALTYAQWGFDMIEADFCGRAGDGETDQELYAHASAAIAAASAATNRTIAFYMCNWGSDAPWKWAPQYANLFRNTVDIQYVAGQCNFPFILRNFDATVVNSGTPPSRPGLPGTGIGAWNDPDMLCTGFRGITDTEGRSQFSLWCVLSAPLLLGTDVRSASAFTMATIGNVEAIAIDQDPLGVQGMEFTLSASQPPANVSFYYKPLLPQAGAQSVALAVLNRGNVALPGVNISFEDLGFALSQRVVVRDIWAQTTSALLQGSFVTRPIDSHETLLLKLTPV